MPCLRDPCSDRGDRQRKAEKKVRRAGEPFRDRVEKNDRQRDRREQERQAINCGCRCNECRGTEYKQQESDGLGNEQVTRSGTRISLIEGPINHSVEKHCCRARKYHAEKDEEQDPRRWPAICRYDQRAQRKRQRKNRVRKTNQSQKPTDWPATAETSTSSMFPVHVAVPVSRNGLRKFGLTLGLFLIHGFTHVAQIFYSCRTRSARGRSRNLWPQLTRSAGQAFQSVQYLKHASAAVFAVACDWQQPIAWLNNCCNRSPAQDKCHCI